jgi:NAD(P)-dependent dehydrogenase (short-subunit alcohol dehydrogenase family)
MVTAASADQRRVALITGAARGIGQGAARALAGKGVHVVCADLAGCDETLALIEDAGGTASQVVLDVRDEQLWRAAVADASGRTGRIDYLANIAGAVSAGVRDSILDLDEDTWNFLLDVDLKGVWLGMRSVMPMFLTSGGGRIVNVSSVAASRGLPGLAAYSAAKAGVEALSRQVAVEFGPHGVAVNVVVPGSFATSINSAVPGWRELAPQRSVFGRAGRVEEVADAIAYALLHEGFITGTTIVVDGGWSAAAAMMPR